MLTLFALILVWVAFYLLLLRNASASGDWGKLALQFRANARSEGTVHRLGYASIGNVDCDRTGIFAVFCRLNCGVMSLLRIGMSHCQGRQGGGRSSTRLPSTIA
jgi:hypothetical protein